MQGIVRRPSSSMKRQCQPVRRSTFSGKPWARWEQTPEVPSRCSSTFGARDRIPRGFSRCTGRLKRIRLPDGTLPPDAEEILKAHIEVLKKLALWPRVEASLSELIAIFEKVRPQDLQRFGYKSDLADLLIKLGRAAEAEALLHTVITALEEAADQKNKVVATHLPLAKKRLVKAVEEKAKKTKGANAS